MNDNLQTLTTSTASERKIGAGGAVGLAQLIAELVERCRQDSYDEGYADAQQAARQDAEAQR